MNNRQKGDYAELMVATRLTEYGWTVLVPFSENERYDLGAERDGEFVRVQVKTASKQGPSARFPCYSNKYNGTGYSADEIDGFAVFSQYYDRCFWVPIEDANAGYMQINVEDETAKHPAEDYRFAEKFGR